MGVESELLKMIDVSIAPLQAQIDAQGKRIALAEEKLFPPKPPEPPAPPPVLKGIEVRDGRFYFRDKPFRNAGVNLVAEACMASDAVLKQELDRIQAAGCTFLRTLHLGKDDGAPDKISGYQPTIAEWRAGFPYLDRLVEETRKRNMVLCITLHHRQRLTATQASDMGVYDTLFAPQPQAGEIRGTFLILPQLEQLVTDYCVELASRYKGESHLMYIIANEVSRYSSYHINDRTKVDAINKSYRVEWFKRFTAFQKELGIEDKEPTGLKSTRSHHYAMFQAKNACEVFGRIYDRLRAAGITNPIGTTNGLGNATQAVVPILARGDFVSWHAYGHIPDLPNPFYPNDIRDLRSIHDAVRVKGLPCILDEHANANEGARKMLEGYSDGPQSAAEAGFDLQAHYCAFQGPPGFLQQNPTAWTNGFDVPGFEQKLKATNDWLNTQPEPVPVRTAVPVTMAQLFGDWVRISEGNWKDVPSPVAGTVKYGGQGIELPEAVMKWGR
jgi:hypothetical protein